MTLVDGGGGEDDAGCVGAGMALMQRGCRDACCAAGGGGAWVRRCGRRALVALRPASMGITARRCRRAVDLPVGESLDWLSRCYSRYTAEHEHADLLLNISGVLKF